MRDHRSILILAGLLSFASTFLAQKKPVHIPFVGCKSDGQLGPRKAPTSKAKAVPISPDISQGLAYYEAEDAPGVLAPRDWYCFGTYGSSGSSLYVAPQPINSADLFSGSWKGFSGPAIQLSVSYGGTSGRFEVAAIIARAVPAHRSFTKRVVSEGLEPASSFPYGPYPHDQLKYKSKEIVEYTTPAQTEGLGTRSHLQKSDAPIRGVAILAGEESNLIHLAVRLPSGMSELIPVIIHQTEHH